jgi:hypothetical protein
LTSVLPTCQLGNEPVDESVQGRCTGEVAPNSDPRVPKTVAAMKKQRDWWFTGSQAEIESGYYRLDIDKRTASATHPQPTYTATWHPNNGPVERLKRAYRDSAHTSCVRHYEASCQSEAPTWSHFKATL